MQALQALVFPHTPLPTALRYILVGSNTMTHKLAEEVAGLYPGGRVRRPLFFAPKWLVWLLGPAVGIPRDAVTVGAWLGVRLGDSGSVGWLMHRLIQGRVATGVLSRLVGATVTAGGRPARR